MFNKKTKISKESIENHKELPNHIAIICDGNGRWAKMRGLPRNAGHIEGANVIEKITNYSQEIGLKYLTFYIFSTENWKRPALEVNFLMKLFKKQLSKTLKNFENNSIKINFLGDTTKFSDEIQNLISEIYKISNSKPNGGLTINLAANYGARAEILTAAKNLAKKTLKNEINLDNIDEKSFSSLLYTKNHPDVDLMIRPGGEQRISNFLLWQCSYAEFVFDEVLWPDFTPQHLDLAISKFSQRKRRFGGI